MVDPLIPALPAADSFLLALCSSLSLSRSDPSVAQGGNRGSSTQHPCWDELLFWWVLLSRFIRPGLRAPWGIRSGPEHPTRDARFLLIPSFFCFGETHLACAQGTLLAGCSSLQFWDSDPCTWAACKARASPLCCLCTLIPGFRGIFFSSVPTSMVSVQDTCWFLWHY